MNQFEAYLRTILPNLLDAHVFSAYGWNLDGTRSDGCMASPGRALIDLGMAESTLDQKRSNNILLKNGPNVTQRTSSDSILLRILISTNDVTFDDLNIDDFGVSSTHSNNNRVMNNNRTCFKEVELLLIF